MPVNKDEIRIAIVDDHPIVIEGLQKILMKAYSYVSTICFTTGNEFLEFLKKSETDIDIVLLDITLPDSNGVDLCKKVKEISNKIDVLAFSNHNERSTIMRMLQNGASGYLLKNASADEVVDCINEAMNGQIALSREIKEILARPTLQDLKELPTLTKREKEILRFIADGHTSVAMAGLLYLSPLTIETHRRNLMQKFGVKNVAELIKFVTKQQII
jgi:DNA-binding NarL/FixJ family response regulator